MCSFCVVWCAIEYALFSFPSFEFTICLSGHHSGIFLSYGQAKQKRAVQDSQTSAGQWFLMR